MTQLNITLNQDEILQLLSDNRGEAFKKLLQENLNSVLKAESQEQPGAQPYERTDQRTDSRNSFRDRELTTRIGKIVLSVHLQQDFIFLSQLLRELGSVSKKPSVFLSLSDPATRCRPRFTA